MMYGYIHRTDGTMNGRMERWIDGWFDEWMGVGINGGMFSISETIPVWAGLD
jgi:hypothetical protein